jgi:hypothetical protein
MTTKVLGLNALIAAKGFVLNSYLQLPGAFSAEVYAAQGWDAITLDYQHGLIGYHDAVAILQAIARTGVLPLVRVPGLESGTIEAARCRRARHHLRDDRTPPTPSVWCGSASTAGGEAARPGARRPGARRGASLDARRRWRWSRPPRRSPMTRSWDQVAVELEVGSVVVLARA